MTLRRCAIYTRKSSEEGLEQEFNSLHAQREACEAYIKSQAHEGWRLIKAAYDDGGFSGGSMERPALARLLEDVKAGKIDIIIVYKVDRLTRSLSDFARIVETLDRQGASFVSVTQQFNTTSSMGRLTLNVLLSFAQFEREVTSERIRDKIAASKAKGMWMGGMAPLGYDLQDRKLIINEAEAETVRAIFKRYLELGSVNTLADDLKQRGIRTKVWTPRHGQPRGGAYFDRLILYRLLKNELYIGRIAFKGKSFEGQHQSILPIELWGQVQTKLASNRPDRSAAKVIPDQAKLTGLVYDDQGNRMSPAFARKANGQRYNYYVSQPLLTGQRDQAGSVGRVPANDLDQLVEVQVAGFLKLSADSASRPDNHRPWQQTIRRVTIHRDRIVIVVSQQGVKKASTVKEIVVPVQLGRRGKNSYLTSTHEKSTKPNPNKALIKALARAHHWRGLLETGEYESIIELTKALGQEPRYARRILQLAFLPPTLTECMIHGLQPAHLTLAALSKWPISLVWQYPVQYVIRSNASLLHASRCNVL